MSSPKKNEYTLMELAGAFGDLGTLIPFILIYTNVMHFDPAKIFLSFGIFNIIIGYIYKTPVPVQSMKAIGSYAATHMNQVTAGMVYGAGLFSGIFWSLLGMTGVNEAVSKIVQKPVTKGIILGLGISFILQGIQMMAEVPLLALLGLVLYLLLQKYKKLPVIFVIMLLGIVYSFIHKPTIGSSLLALAPTFAIPSFDFSFFNLTDFFKGALILALPQIPLTLGNGVIALVEENNLLFPDRKVSNRKVVLTTGLMNLISPFLGGVPMCHGAGGMAGHVRFGARTGGATVFLGIMLVMLALFFSNSLDTVLGIFPGAILGIILLVAGIELAFSSYLPDMDKAAFSVIVLTAAVTMWNVGVGMLVGVIATNTIFKGRENTLLTTDKHEI